MLEGTEGHFLDFKGKELKPASLSKTISAFANASGGEIFLGVDEVEGLSGKEHHWNGFDEQEAANGTHQVLHDLDPSGADISTQFLTAKEQSGFILHVLVEKSQRVIKATSEKVYLRKGAQNLPLTAEAIDRLKFDKGIKSYEDEILNIDHDEISNSETVIEFMLGTAWIQTSSATVDLKATISSAIASAGVLHPRVFLGRLFIRFATSFSHVWLAPFRSVPLGMN
nr:ATP-binding protein [Octadecabacter arcticus]